MTHLKAHTQEKNFKCKFCDMAFCDSSTLKKHVRTHTGEKPYVCHLCPKSFTQSGNLKRHMATHKKQKSVATFSVLPTNNNNSNKSVKESKIKTQPFNRLDSKVEDVSALSQYGLTTQPQSQMTSSSTSFSQQPCQFNFYNPYLNYNYV